MLWLYRTVDGFRWRRRTATGTLLAWSQRGHGRKVAMWRDARRHNRDHATCRVDDRTFTWTRNGTNLSRPAGPAEPREFLPIPELRKRL